MSSMKQCRTAHSDRKIGESIKTGVSRRTFVKHAVGGAGAFAVTGGMSSAFAQSADTIKIGFISPRTGPLGSFGESDPYVLDLARKALASGLTSNGKTYKVEIIDRDSQSDPARAGQLAKALITTDQVDLMLVTSTPEVVNPVSDVCEASGVPCVSTVLPWEAWYFGRGARPGQPSPFKWTYHFAFGVADLTSTYTSMWGNGQVATNKKVGLMCPNDADGNAIRRQMIPLLEKAGFSVFDPGGYEDGTTDYSTQIAKYKEANVEIFTGAPIPPDFATFWRQSAQLGLTKTIKIQSIGKTGLFPSQIEALGPLGYKIAIGCMWHPTYPYKSPLTGGTARELAEGYEKNTGRQWHQQLGTVLSLLDVGTEVLKAANAKDRADVAKTLSHFKVTTSVGPVEWGKFPIANVSPTSLVGSQWIQAPAGSKYKVDLVIVDNTSDPSVPVSAKLQPYS